MWHLKTLNMSILAIIFWIIIALIAYALRDYIIIIAVFVGSFMGIGALLFWWWFDNPSLGAYIGLFFSTLIGLRYIQQALGASSSTFFEFIYRIISLPFWFLNRVQLILTGPWRYIFKYVSIQDNTRNVLRPLLYAIEIILYVVTTPLRLLNAILYNIFIYGITEIYDLTCEVFFPNNYDEGKGDFWEWIIWFPYRLIKYPLFHGILVIIEGFIWTVNDIFIPTITMYHGTNLEAAQSIVGSSKRNKSLWSNWLAGTFKASNSANGWGGLGVYFAPSRMIAGWYSVRAGGTPVIIACRVSMGRILNYALAPTYVEANVGGSGQHSVLNRYADQNGYTTAEWWNGSYWEYCMFDWQNRYNNPWRIRPIYVLNRQTGLAQHIDGGFRHWLFSKAVIDDISRYWSFVGLIYFSAFVTAVAFYILFLYFRQNLLSTTPIKYEPVKEYVVKEPEMNSSSIIEETTIEKTTIEEPVKPVTPSSTPSSSSSYKPEPRKVSNESKKKSNVYENKRKSSSKQNPTKNKNGFRLEKVDDIPTENNSTKTGFHLEKVDRIPTKE